MLALLRFLCCPIVGLLALSVVRSLVANKTPRLSLTDRITHAKGVPWGNSGAGAAMITHRPDHARTAG
jgi:predicted Na+-dependent transporter